MANLIDYLEWRGDLSFEAAPFTVVDAMILCQLSYYNYEGLVPDEFGDEPVLLKDACIQKVLFPLPNYCTKEDPAICRLARESRRFSEIRMTGFVNKINEKKQSQFCAVTYLLGKTGTFVAFRGTDDSLVGWKENMELAYNDEVPAQKAAVSYLKSAAAAAKGPLYVGGHSKGGNLAVYSAAFSGVRIRKRLRNVYNFDGPGFNFRVSLKDNFKAIVDKVSTFVPQDSIVGLLLEHKEFYQVIHSIGKNGFAQHRLITWEITKDGIVREEKLSRSGENYREYISEWINAMSFEERKEFVDVIYRVLSEYKTTGEVFTAGSLWKILKEFRNLPEEEKGAVSAAARELKKTISDNLKERLDDLYYRIGRFFKD